MAGDMTALPVTDSKDPWAGDLLDKTKKEGAAKREQLAAQIADFDKQIAELDRIQGKETNSPEKQAVFAQKSAVQAQHAIADAAAKGLNPDGTAIRPDWHSLVDSGTGQLKEQYKLGLQGLDPTKWDAYQKYKQENMRDAGQLSPWAQLQMQKQGVEEAGAKDAAAKQAMSANAQAMSQLAMRGGLGGGARGMAAQQMQRDLLAQRQGVNKQGMLSRLGIQTQDEQNRQAGLQNLMGSEKELAQYNKTLEGKQAEYNMNNLMQEIQGRRAFDMGLYGEQMKQWGANKQSEAIKNSGGGGGK